MFPTPLVFAEFDTCREYCYVHLHVVEDTQSYLQFHPCRSKAFADAYATYMTAVTLATRRWMVVLHAKFRRFKTQAGVACPIDDFTDPLLRCDASSIYSHHVFQLLSGPVANYARNFLLGCVYCPHALCETDALVPNETTGHVVCYQCGREIIIR